MTRTTLSLADTASLAAAIVAIGGGALGLYRGIMKIYRRTVGSRRDLARRLNQLGAGVTIRWVEERFGTPAFVRFLEWPEVCEGATSTKKAHELVYREKHAWLQIIANEHDAVLRFSVTVTDPWFRFHTWLLTNCQLKVRLGRSSFADIRSEPAGRSLRIGAHNREYAEAYWFGNPGNYQWFVFSHNDAGTGAFDFSIESREHGYPKEGVLAVDISFAAPQPFDQTFRAKTVINTLTVLGPLQDPVGLTEPRGPDSNQVRVLVPGARQRWKTRWHIRRLIRQANRRTRRLQTASEPVPAPVTRPGDDGHE